MAYIDLTRDTIIRRIAKATERDQHNTQHNPQKSSNKSTQGGSQGDIQGGSQKPALSPEEITKALNRTSVESPLELCDALVGEGILFRRGEKSFVPRSSYFSEGKVLIKPTEEELERGILIPGHRFLPLYDNSIHPKQIEVRAGRKKLKRTMISHTLQGLGIYYSIFGIQEILGLIAVESEENPTAITEKDNIKSLLRISAFDMKQLYREWEIGPGDYLVAQVENWQKGNFSLSASPKGPISDKKRQEWVTDLDEGFAALFSEIPWPLPPEEELARAVFRAGRSCIEQPALNIGGYLAESSLVDLVQLEGDSYLWEKNREIEPHNVAKAGTVESRLRDSYLEELLAHYELPVPMPYTEACIRQNIEDNKDLSRLLYNIFTGVDLEMLSRQEWYHLVKAIENYEKRISKEIESRPPDKKLAYERDKYILLYQNIIEWYLKVENQFDDIESLEIGILQEIQDTAFECVDVLHILNTSSGPLDEETKATLEGRYRTLLKSFHQKAEILHEQSMDIQFAQRREERLQSTVASEYLVLDVILEDLDPPVSRKLRVPETMTLGDLHNILQQSFGWKDYHLHSFYAGRTEYTDMETFEKEFVDEAQPQDEESLRIEEIPDLGGELLYVYDYGDTWRHTIRLRQVIQAAEVPKEERETAICLDAQGAGPPEDSGGPQGYQELIEALHTPASQRNDRQEEIVTWAGDWSPGNYSLDEINSLLAKL